MINLLTEYIVSKIIVDRPKIPYSHYKKIEPLLNEVADLSETIDGIKINEPYTWIRSFNKISKHLVDKSKEPINENKHIEFIKSKGYTVSGYTFTEWCEEFLIRRKDLIKIELGDEDSYAASIDLGDGIKLYFYGSHDEDEKSENIMDGKRFFYPENKEDRDELLKKMGDMVWDDNTHMFFDSDDENLSVSKYIPRNKNYYGDGKRFIEIWKKYMDAEVRRVVVLQGVPGTGKSTLCSYAASELSDRTISVSLKFIKSFSDSEWFGLIDILNPKMVIIDDIDRIEERHLSKRLTMFEEGEYNVPLTIFTTNDDSKLPDAMRRPGRIDSIIEMPTPPREGQLKMIDEFKKDVGIDFDIPKEQVNLLLKVFDKTRSGAYVKEMMKRYMVEGIDYVIDGNDISFGDVIDDEYSDDI